MFSGMYLKGLRTWKVRRQKDQMEIGTGNIKQQSEHANNLYVNTILNKTKTKNR